MYKTDTPQTQSSNTANLSTISGKLLFVQAIAFSLLIFFLWSIGLGTQYIQAKSVLYVATTGTNSGPCTTADAPCATLQYALSQAVSNDEIRVAGGTYSGATPFVVGQETFTQHVYINKSVVLRGGFNTANWIEPDPTANQTILDAQDQGRVIYIGSGLPTIEGFVIINGTSPVDENGGGIYVKNGASVALKHNVIQDNHAYIHGAGIYNKGTLFAEYNQIYNNISDFGWGGGIYADGVAEILYNDIYDNTAWGIGGGINTGAQGAIHGNNIYNNQLVNPSGSDGGGIGIFLSSPSDIIDLTIENNFIYNNSAYEGGGVMFYGSGVKLYNNTIVSNTVSTFGGGIYIWNGVSNTELINNIIANNAATTEGGGLYDAQDTPATQNYNNYNGNTAPTNPDSNVGLGDNALTSNPGFVSVPGQDYHLSSGSANRDAGDPTIVPDFDVDGNVRPFDAVDIGADEYYPSGNCFALVNDTDIYDDLQTAVSNASFGNTVKVAGHCKGLGANGAVLYISQTLTIQGGYTVTNWTEPSYGPTILDGENIRRVVHFDPVLFLTPVLEGFYIINGSAATGAGILVDGTASPTIRNNVLYNNNTSTSNGGGIYVTSGNPIIVHNTLYDNSTGGFNSRGGGIYVFEGDPIIVNNMIVNNSSSGDGGGIASENAGDPVVRYNNVFNNNGGDYSSEVVPGPGNISANPQFTDAANGNLHILETSPGIGAADPNYQVIRDFDGQARPRGVRADMGADEATFYPDIIIDPDYYNVSSVTNTTVVHTHQLINNGTIADTFDVDYTHSNGWNVVVNPTGAVSLGIGEQIDLTVSVDVPLSGLPGEKGTTLITATSQTNPNVSATATDITRVKINPAATFVPDRVVNVDPGDSVVLNHTLTNLAEGEDVYVLTTQNLFPSTQIEGTLLQGDPFTVTLDKNESIQVSLAVTVPLFAEASLENQFRIVATSQEDGIYEADVLDTVIVNAISGDRYVHHQGIDTINNCTVITYPCLTIQHGLETVIGGSTVHVASGEYQEHGITINGNVTLRGGWDGQKPDQHIDDPSTTVIDALGNGRVMQLLNGTITVRGFTFKNGDVPEGRGGAIWITGSGKKTIDGNQFIANNALEGGAIAGVTGTPLIQNNVIYSNTAVNHGGGIYLTTSQGKIFNNTIIENEANSNGGGIYNNLGSIIISNTDITSNTANNGGGVFNNTGSVAMDYNNFYGNTAPSNPNYRNATPGSHTRYKLGVFEDPIAGNSENLYFQHSPLSPLIDAGDPSSNVLTDYEGDQRPVNQGYDIGADELAGCNVELQSSNPNLNGTAYGIIQDAVDVAEENDTVLISGYCRGVHSIQVGNQTISQSIHLTKQVHLMGSPTAIVDAQKSGRVLYLSGDINPTIESLIFINGNASGFGGGPSGQDAGGGIYIVDSSPIFYRMTISGSMAYLGGGVYNRLGQVTFTDALVEQPDEEDISKITGNMANGNGGGYYNYQGTSLLDHTHLMSNTAQSGAGLYNQAGPVTYDSSYIYYNTATSNGGGLYNASTFPVTLTNLVLYTNTATSNGAGFYVQQGSPRIWNVTTHRNQAGGNGGAIYVAGGSPSISNTIMFQNSANQGGGISVAGGSPSLAYNDVYLNTGGDYHGIANQTGTNGNLAIDPLFKDKLYHLSDLSPLLDAGDPDTTVKNDFEHQPRPGDGGYEIGADEVVGCLAIINDDISNLYGGIQRAVEDSQPGDTVNVSGHCRGVHQITVSGLGTISTTAHILKNVDLYGGWDENFGNRDISNNPTYIDAVNRGHVIYIGSSVTTTIDGFHIIRGKEGGIFNNSNAGPHLSHNQIYSHTSTNAIYGGAIHNNGGNIIVEAGNYIYNNTAVNGAAFYSSNGNPTLYNNFIYDNVADTNGGGIYISNGNPTIWHNTLYGNKVLSGEGSGFYRASGNPDFRNNLVASGEGTALYGQGGTVGTGQVDYNNVISNTQTGNLFTIGANNIQVIPLFLSPDSYDFQLQDTSPVIDKGDPDLYEGLTIPLLDIDFQGDIRPSHQGMDIGADEIGGCYVRNSSNTTPEISGTIYANPQYVIDLADTHDTIDIAGECWNANDRNGTNQTIYVDKSLTIQGGWSIGFSPDQRGITTLNPRGKGHAIYISSGITGTIDRFRITGADTNAPGGAIYNDGSGYTIQNNFIFNNQATSGAGIYNESGNAKILFNTFYNNTASNASSGGGGIYVGAGNPVINNNLFSLNEADDGSAVYVNGGSPTIEYNDAWQNIYAQADGDYNITVDSTNIYTDPIFVSIIPYEGGLPTVDFLKLGTGSFVIDQADSNATVDHDIHGDPRPNDLGFDIGADEYTSCLVRLVDNQGMRIYGRVQNAINAFTVGSPGEIQVAGVCRLAPGQTQIAVVDRNDLTFTGGWDLEFETKDIEGTPSILDGRNLGRLVEVTENVTTTFDSGFIFTNGYADNGGAFYIGSNSSIAIQGVNTIISNTATSNGGAIYIDANSQLLLLNNLDILSNTATTNGGAIYNNQGTVNISAAVANDIIRINTNIAGGRGGAIYNNSGTNGSMTIQTAAEFTTLYINQNTAGSDGGAIYNTHTLLLDTPGAFSLITVNNNQAGNNGGSIYNGANGDLDLIGTWGLILNYNYAENSGGSIYTLGDFFTNGVDGLDGNIANTGQGGGVYNEGFLEMRNSGSSGNVSTGHGGGVYTTNGTEDAVLTNVYLYANTVITGSGGGIYSNHPTTFLLHNTIRRNEVSGSGGGVFNAGGSELFVNGTILMSNTATTGGGGIHNNGTTHTETDYNNYYQNVPTHTVGLAVGANSTYLNPRFGSDSPVLHVESPLRDKGDPNSGSIPTPPLYGEAGLTFDCCATPRPGTDRNPPEIGIGSYNDPGMWEIDINYSLDFVHEGLDPDETIKEMCGDPGTVVTFTHYLQNTGDLTDSFVITSTSVPGWASLITPNNVNDLPVNEAVEVIVTSQIPADATPFLNDINLITAASIGSKHTEKVTLTDITCVNEIIQFEIAPNHIVSAAPGETVVFEHTVTNTGNVSDVVKLSIDPPPYGEVLLYNLNGNPVDVYEVLLGIGSSTSFTVSYTVPDWLAGGIQETFFVVATSSKDPSVETSAFNTINIEYISGTRHVSPNGDDTDNNCTDFGVIAPPCQTLAYALSQATDGDLMKIAKGTYSQLMTATVGSEDIKAILYLDKAVSLQGGYSVSNWEFNKPLINKTIFNPNNNGRSVYVDGPLELSIEGLHMTNGSAITGGAIYNGGANLTLIANNLYNNSATSIGGAIYSNGDITMQNNVVYNNGNNGLYNVGPALIEYNTFYNNDSSSNGGAVYHSSGDITANNNIFSDNTATSSGGAIFITGAGNATVDNNNFYNNNSDVAGATSTNDHTFNPQLVDPANGDFHLTKGSPAEEVGTAPVGGVPEDFERDIRPQGDDYDIGADERLHIPGVQINPDYTTETTNFNELISYIHTITNTGEDPDVFTLTHSSTQGWANFSQIPQTVSLNPGETTQVTVDVTTGPNGSGGLLEITTITATSKLSVQKFRRIISDTAVNTTSVEQDFDLAFIPNRTGSGVPGGSVTYQHTLINHGNGPDTVAFTAQSSEGWQVILPQPITLEAEVTGSNYTATVEVTINIPPGVGGASDTTIITATSVNSSNPVHQVSVEDITTVDVLRGVSLEAQTPAEKSGPPASTVQYTHLLVNTGNANDTINLSATSSRGWTVTANPSQITLDASESAQIEVSVTIPPATPANQVDITTLTAVSASDASATASSVNTTTVTSSSGVWVGPDSFKVVDPGTSVTHQNMITNVGNITDGFTLDYVSSSGWFISGTTGPIDLTPGQSAQITVQVDVPAGAQPAQFDDTTLTARSVSNTSIFDTALYTTRVLQQHGLTFVADESQTAAPNTAVQYTHTLQNTGEATDTFKIEATSSNGWVTVANPAEVTLSSGESQQIAVNLSVPGGTSGQQDTMTVVASSIISPAFSASVVDTTSISDTVPPQAGVSLTPDQGLSILAGTTVHYTHTLRNTGNIDDSFTLNATSDQGWTVTLVPATPVQLAASTSKVIVVKVTIPASTTVGTVDNTTVVATSGFDGSVTDSAIDTTTVTDQRTIGVSLNPNHNQIAVKGSTLNYEHNLVNKGNGIDTFTLDSTSTKGWAVLNPPTSVDLQPNETYILTVTVSVPVTATNGMTDINIITATSVLSSVIFDTAINQTEVGVPTINEIYLPLIMKQHTSLPTVTPTPTNTGETPTDTPTPTPTGITPTDTPTPTATPTVINGVDLIVTDITIIPNPPVPGQSARVQVTIRNQGTVAVTPGNNGFLDFFVDPATPPVVGDLGDIYWDILGEDLPALTSKTYEQSFTFTSGSHEIYALVDSGGNISEVLEDNNLLGPISLSAKPGTIVDDGLQIPFVQPEPRLTATPSGN